mgnify:CR=1 FL=1
MELTQQQQASAALGESLSQLVGQRFTLDEMVKSMRMFVDEADRGNAISTSDSPMWSDEHLKDIRGQSIGLRLGRNHG